MPVYAEHLRNIIKEGVKREDGYDKPLRGFHICVDAGNGGGGYFATDVLAPLGADISGPFICHMRLLFSGQQDVWGLLLFMREGRSL